MPLAQGSDSCFGFMAVGDEWSEMGQAPPWHRQQAAEQNSGALLLRVSLTADGEAVA
jgi:hypothetical protein